MSTIVTLIAAAAIAIVPAAPAQTTPSLRVATHDLDLTTTKGQHVLRLRIARAASALCDVADARFGANVRVAQRLCRVDATATALASAPPAVRFAMRSTRSLPVAQRSPAF
jgi:UrcA family protein